MKKEHEAILKLAECIDRLESGATKHMGKRPKPNWRFREEMIEEILNKPTMPTNKTIREDCYPHNFIEVGGNCTNCGISSVTTTDNKTIFFDNLSTSLKGRSGKSRGATFYLDAIKELGMDREFAKLEAFCTDGDIRPPYPYQWRATSTLLAGDDDPFEGLGETPLEALRNLYAQMKEFNIKYN